MFYSVLRSTMFFQNVLPWRIFFSKIFFFQNIITVRLLSFSRMFFHIFPHVFPSRIFFFQDVLPIRVLFSSRMFFFLPEYSSWECSIMVLLPEYFSFYKYSCRMFFLPEYSSLPECFSSFQKVLLPEYSHSFQILPECSSRIFFSLPECFFQNILLMLFQNVFLSWLLYSFRIF